MIVICDALTILKDIRTVSHSETLQDHLRSIVLPCRRRYFESIREIAWESLLFEVKGTALIEIKSTQVVPATYYTPWGLHCYKPPANENEVVRVCVHYHQCDTPLALFTFKFLKGFGATTKDVIFPLCFAVFKIPFQMYNRFFSVQ
ncbi:unnamed protein product [Cylicocyclus nassatus]|uniref:Uncharacterized protein n=1 Tax=Cylicocyclus nassatus TaxID=53992 RepID=A0AA36GK41_CYLNA|nr:unnamed protein product [Cylicocyclus nassatus]